MRSVTRTTGGFALVALAAVAIVFLVSRRAEPAPTQPLITWTPDHVAVTLPPGESVETGSKAPAALSWETYRDNTYRYSIQYPSVARVSSKTPSSAMFEFAESFELPDRSSVSDTLVFAVQVHDNREGLSAQQWAERHHASDPDTVRAREELAVDGAPAFRVAVWEIDETTHYVVVAKESSLYELSYIDPGSASLAFPEALRRKYDDIFRTMLRSFHFEETRSRQ